VGCINELGLPTVFTKHRVESSLLWLTSSYLMLLGKLLYCGHLT